MVTFLLLWNGWFGRSGRIYVRTYLFFISQCIKDFFHRISIFRSVSSLLGKLSFDLTKVKLPTKNLFFIKLAVNVFKLKILIYLYFIDIWTLSNYLTNYYLASKNVSKKFLYSKYSFWSKYNRSMIFKKWILQ